MVLAPSILAFVGIALPMVSLVVLVLVIAAIFQIRDNTRRTADRLAEILRRMDEMNGTGRGGA